MTDTKEGPVKPKTIALISAGLVLAASQPASAIQCWTNREGIRECGNAVPPEYAQQRVRTLDERGFTVEIQERAKTKEEAAEEQRRQAEEERRQAEAKQRQEAQATYDRVLLSTFTTEQELLASRDRKVAAIDATIEVTGLSIENISEALKRYQKRAANLERSGRPVSDALQKDIAGLKAQIASKQKYIDAKTEEKAAIQEKYQQDLERFRYLKGR